MHDVECWIEDNIDVLWAAAKQSRCGEACVPVRRKSNQLLIEKDDEVAKKRYLAYLLKKAEEISIKKSMQRKTKRHKSIHQKMTS